MATKQTNENQGRIWRVRCAIVERQSLILRCEAIIDSARVGATWGSWQELQDRATLAQVTLERATREVADLQEILRAL